jgi:hypothetical protein
MDAIDTNADALRYVFIERPRCPVCSSPDLKTLRSVTADGVTSRRTECLGCHHKFFVVLDD